MLELMNLVLLFNYLNVSTQYFYTYFSLQYTHYSSQVFEIL